MHSLDKFYDFSFSIEIWAEYASKGMVPLEHEMQSIKASLIGYKTLFHRSIHHDLRGFIRIFPDSSESSRKQLWRGTRTSSEYGFCY